MSSRTHAVPRRWPAAGTRLACAIVAMGVVAGTAASAQALTPPRLYWTDPSLRNIGVANIDGTGQNATLIAFGQQVVGVAASGQRLYWANEGGQEIGVADLDGNVISQGLVTGLGNPEWVAVDAQHVYWADDNSPTAIGRANLDGSDPQPHFIPAGNEPGAIAISDGHIYWANINDHAIGRANLDGSDPNNQFITTTGDFPTGVAADGQHVYWTTFGSGTIGEANVDGTGINQSLISGQSSPQGLVDDGQHLYWDNDGTGEIGEANLDGTDVSTVPNISSGGAGLAITVPTLTFSPATPAAFSATPQGSMSPPQTLTLANTGQRAMTVSALSFAGANPGDFVLTSNGCLGSIAPGQSCQVTVSFAPQAQGARTAGLQVFSTDFADSPEQVALSGTGGALPTGPAGATGATGPAGAKGPMGTRGPKGPRGPAGKIELVTCRTVNQTVTRGGHAVQVTHRRCTARLVSGKVTFNTAAERDTLSRAGALYATGTGTSAGHGRRRLTLVPLRRLIPGRYTLTSIRSERGRRVSRRTRIQIS